jgi:anti-sigma28 factor (negative regulator of flagellin synthesis)
MKIDNNISTLTTGLDAAGVQQAAQMKQAGQAAVDGRGYEGGGDQAQISGFASQLSALASSSDPARLARLQTAYESGTYSVPAGQIANSIIGYALGN